MKKITGDPFAKSANLANYHLLSKTVSRAFDEFIMTELSKRPDSPLLQELYKKFFTKKLGTNHQRVTWVFIAAKYFDIDTDKHFQELLKLAAVPELLIWSEYAFNWVTDGKNNDSGTKYEDNMNLITCQYLLTEVVYFIPERMLKRYLELYRWGIYGCLVVERDLLITNWENMRDKDIFWKAYSDNHCIPDVGALYGYCFELVHDYFKLGLDKKFLERIYQVGFEFGRGLQMNGDLSDFLVPNELVATTEKRAVKDYFIDIRTDRLTYPSWLLLTELEKEDSPLFNQIMTSAQKRTYPDENFYFYVHKALKKRNIVPQVIRFLRHEKKRLTGVIRNIGITNEGSELWKASIVLLVSNKFLRQIRQDYAS